MYVRFRNYILIYETFSYLVHSSPTQKMLVRLKYVVKLRLKEKLMRKVWSAGDEVNAPGSKMKEN